MNWIKPKPIKSVYSEKFNLKKFLDKQYVRGLKPKKLDEDFLDD